MLPADRTPVADDVVLSIWAAIALLSDAGECSDATELAELLSTVETILTDVISQVVRCAVLGSFTSTRPTLH
jgi:hypothetical protein